MHARSHNYDVLGTHNLEEIDDEVSLSSTYIAESRVGRRPSTTATCLRRHSSLAGSAAVASGRGFPWLRMLVRRWSKQREKSDISYNAR